MAKLLADGFHDAFLGFGRQNGKEFAVYDYDKCVTILRKRDKMTKDEAIEFLESNTLQEGRDPGGDDVPCFVIFMTLKAFIEMFGEHGEQGQKR